MILAGLFLRLVSLFKVPLLRTGVNPSQLHYILKIKFALSTRKPLKIGRNADASLGVEKGSFWVVLLTAVSGFIGPCFAYLQNESLMRETVYFSFLMLFIAQHVTSDLTSLLSDPRDRLILIPRPVSNTTLIASLFLNLFFYSLEYTFILGLTGFVFVGFSEGVRALPLFVIQLFLADLFVVVLVVAIYIFSLRLFSNRFKKRISLLLQLTSSLTAAIPLIVLGPLIAVLVNPVRLSDHKWIYFLPSTWIASLNELVFHAYPVRPPVLLIGALAVLLPGLGTLFILKKLAPNYFSLTDDVEASADGSEVTKRRKKSTLIRTLFSWIVRSPLERAGFNLTRLISSRSYEFKIAMATVAGTLPMYFFYMFIAGSQESLADKYIALSAGVKYIYLAYGSTMILIALLSQTSYSKLYQASYVFYVAGIQTPGQVLSGQFKAVVFCYFLPFYFLLTLIIIYIWGISVIPNLVLALFIILSVTLISCLYFITSFPFSKPVPRKGSSKQLLRMLGFLFLYSFLAYGQGIISRFPVLVSSLAIFAAVLFCVLLANYKKQTWDEFYLSDI